MKIARVLHEGAARTAIVVDDAVRVIAAEVDVPHLLAAEPGERERLAGRVSAERPIAEVRLLAPVQPPTIRDFSVFEQHIEGVRRVADPEAKVPEVFYESPFCYFSNPHALTGPEEEIAVPPGCERLDLELEVAAVIGRDARSLDPAEAERHIAGYTIFNDWSATCNSPRDAWRDAATAEAQPPVGKARHRRRIGRPNLEES